MELTLHRFNKGTNSTIGLLFIGKGSAKYFHSFTLEDEHRNIKVMNETRIPAGRYQIKLRNKGGMTKRYAARYSDIHKGMLHLQNVEGFKYVYIHIGNDDDETSGCILTGYSSSSDAIHGGGTIGRSEAAYLDLYKKAATCLSQGDEVHITITDEEIQMNWILERLKEPSTYKGISLLLGVIGYVAAPDQLELIGGSVIAAYAAIESIRKENP